MEVPSLLAELLECQSLLALNEKHRKGIVNVENCVNEKKLVPGREIEREVERNKALDCPSSNFLFKFNDLPQRNTSLLC